MMKFRYVFTLISLYGFQNFYSWDAIEEAEPDEIDLQMLNETKNDPDCHEFIKESDIDWN